MCPEFHLQEYTHPRWCKPENDEAMSIVRGKKSRSIQFKRLFEENYAASPKHGGILAKAAAGAPYGN
jgi:hypothetical protein